MFINKLSQRTISGLLLAASMMSTASSAQEIMRPVPDGPRGARVPVLQCCQCAGREAPQIAPLSLNTGTATWNVTTPGGIGSGTLGASNAAWGPALVAGASWISPTGNPTAVGIYKYITSFDARRCTIPSSITISGKFLADNKGTLYVDGVMVASSLGTANYGFLPGSLTPFSYTIPASASGGVHTITMQADNIGGPTGIDVQVSVKRNCPQSLEASGKGGVDEGGIDNPN